MPSCEIVTIHKHQIYSNIKQATDFFTD